jgi:hypothetical protein
MTPSVGDKEQLESGLRILARLIARKLMAERVKDVGLPPMTAVGMSALEEGPDTDITRGWPDSQVGVDPDR